MSLSVNTLLTAHLGGLHGKTYFARVCFGGRIIAMGGVSGGGGDILNPLLTHRKLNLKRRD